MDKEDKELEKVLLKWAKDEEKLNKEIKEIKEELLLLRKQPTPEEFDKQYKIQLNKLKRKFGDNYFDGVYTSNRYWVMGKEKMTDKKFQDILTMICEDIKKEFVKSQKSEVKK